MMGMTSWDFWVQILSSTRNFCFCIWSRMAVLLETWPSKDHDEDGTPKLTLCKEWCHRSKPRGHLGWFGQQRSCEAEMSHPCEAPLQLQTYKYVILSSLSLGMVCHFNPFLPNLWGITFRNLHDKFSTVHMFLELNTECGLSRLIPALVQAH